MNAWNGSAKMDDDFDDPQTDARCARARRLRNALWWNRARCTRRLHNWAALSVFLFFLMILVPNPLTVTLMCVAWARCAYVASQLSFSMLARRRYKSYGFPSLQ